MSGKERNDPGYDPVEVCKDSAGEKARDEGKKRIQKRKLVLEGVLGFLIGLLTKLLPMETVLFLLLSCLLLLLFLPLILLTD